MREIALLGKSPEEKAEMEKRYQECDRLTAERSTYWSCCCGLDHVPGCKTARTEWAVKLGLGIILGLVLCWIF